MSSTLVVKTAVCGYHVHRTVWEPHVGEGLIVIQVSGNSYDRYVMAVYHRDKYPGIIVGRLPKEIFETYHYFTRHSTHLALTRHLAHSLGTHKAFGSLDGVLAHELVS